MVAIPGCGLVIYVQKMSPGVAEEVDSLVLKV